MTIYSIIGQSLIGWLFADFLTGLLHWVGDSEKLSKTRVIKLLSGFNTSHHSDPLAITRQSFVARNSSQWAIVSVISLVWFFLAGFSFVWLACTLGGMITGQVHSWAHAPKTAPSLVRLLQEIGVFQSPKHHAAHHRPPHSVRFCVLTDWLNPVLDTLRFWPRLERLLPYK